MSVAHCMTCKTEVTIADATPKPMKNGATMVTGRCPGCGKGVARIEKKSAAHA
jgi:hypothetical protein